jgi:hypothetical protein
MRSTAFIFAAAIAASAAAIPVKAAGLRDQLIGAWSMVSNVETYQDGNSYTWGPDAKGMLIFEPNGQFSQQVGVGGREKVAGNPALNPKGRFIGYFGTYDVSDADKTVTLHIVRSSSPIWDDTDQKRLIVSITGDQYVTKTAIPIPSDKGPFTPTVTWQRMK